MGRIVAAPTAGSCGILPAALLTMQEERIFLKGIVSCPCLQPLPWAWSLPITHPWQAPRADVRPSAGSAAAMAAAAIVELAGGTPRMAGHAIAIAIKNILGLVCDPVAGLVEIPCIKRNASGVAGAFCGGGAGPGRH